MRQLAQHHHLLNQEISRPDMQQKIWLPQPLNKRLSALASTKGCTKAFIAIEALHAKIETLEELYLAEKRLLDVKHGISKTHSLNDIESALEKSKAPES